MVGVDDDDDDDDHVGKAESTRCTLQLYQMWFQMIGVRSSKSLRSFTEPKRSLKGPLDQKTLQLLFPFPAHCEGILLIILKIFIN